MSVAGTPRAKPEPSVEGVLTWMDLMETCEQLVLAGLRHSIGPDGDLDAAYRDWNARQVERDDARIARMLQRSVGVGADDGH